MLPVGSVCEVSEKIIQFLDFSISFEYLVIPNLVNLGVGPFTNTLLHVLEISTVHCFGYLHR